MAQKESVKEIVVIENDAEIAKLIFPRLQEHLKGKVTLVVDNLYRYNSRKKFDFIWFDIWRGHGEFEAVRPALIERFQKNCDPSNMRFWNQLSVRGLLPLKYIAQRLDDGGSYWRNLKFERPYLFKPEKLPAGRIIFRCKNIG